MARYSSIQIASSLVSLRAPVVLPLLLLFGAAASALQVPAGTELQVRLKTKLSTNTSKPKDPVEAVVVAPVMVNGEFVIPAGATVRGAVESVSQSTKGDERSMLALAFNELDIDNARVKIAAHVSGVDNARESVDEQGRITGIVASETISGQLDSGLNKLADRAAGFAGILSTIKGAVLKAPESDITYDAGVDFTLKLSAPVDLKGPSGPGPAAKLVPIADEDGLAALVQRQPFQTWAEKPSKPSDITNIMLVGTPEQVQQAFTAAGWSNAATLNTQAKLETFRAIAEQRGYKEAPVSVLLLENKPPDLVFEKLNNTFAQRHHLRVWRRPETFQGSPVWVIAATHDTGIDFSQENRTFIHKIDPQIDHERAKVVNDLLFTGHVRSVALVERPNVPQHGQNATGDNVDTDAKIAVLVLQ